MAMLDLIKYRHLIIDNKFNDRWFYVVDEEKYFKQIRNLRQKSIKLLESCERNKVDIVPEGFSNHIWWNVGHLLVAWDSMTYPYMNKIGKLPDMYYRLFPKGTRPSEWAETPPSYQEVFTLFNNQVEEIIEACKGQLHKPLTIPFIPRVDTMEKMIKFLMKEETKHYQVIERIKIAL